MKPPLPKRRATPKPTRDAPLPVQRQSPAPVAAELPVVNEPAILARLEGVKPTGPNQWIAKCPAHDDDDPSLSVGVGDDGGTVVHCQAGCETEKVLAELGMKMAELMPQNRRPLKAKGRVVATYDYRDEAGELLSQVCRMEPKDFRQRRPDGKHGWTWNLKGTRRVPYRFPELLKADPQAVVFVVEGEKDVDNLTSAGLVATCNAGGVGKWPAEFAEHLRDRRVVILPDNDSAGRNHAEKVASSLVGKASSIKVLELPGLPDKADVSDWVDAGGTAGELVDLAEAAEEWKPTEQCPPVPKAVVTNGRHEGDEESVRLVPIPMVEVVESIFRATGDWPHQVDGALFIDDEEHGICWLDSPAAFFGWLQSECGIVEWRRGQGCVTKEETFHEVRKNAPRHKAIETLPHQPQLPGHYYACQTPASGDGSTFAEFAEFFSLETDLDRQLLVAAFATPLWGGPAGSRPACMITAKRGRGKGKTKLAEKIARLYGGHIDISAQEDIGAIKQRLLSPQAAPKRIALLDNVKSTRFSWGELEALITTDTISGKRLYLGDWQRPNHLCWLITLNGASLSTDMAQRIVEIRVTEPAYRATWEENVNTFIDAKREAIIGDLVGFLQRPKKSLRRHSRWASWEAEILGRTESPNDCLDLILARRGQCDVEEEEGAVLEDAVAARLKRLDYDPDRDDVHISNEVMCRWYNAAMNDRLKVTGVSRALRQAIDEGRITRLVVNASRTYGRGFRWIGEHADARDPTHYDVGHRLARKRESEKHSPHQDDF